MQRPVRATTKLLYRYSDDKPLIVQFAAKNVDDFVSAAELISPYSDGVDLNCGCPQRWAMTEGYGAELLSNPQLIKEMVQQVRNSISKPFTVSVKIRIKNDLKETIHLCQNLEACGVSFLTVHGRTVKERSEPVNTEAIRTIVDSVNIPVIANGDIKSLSDCFRMNELTNCKGVMAARGILQNPAMFAGMEKTPLCCIQDWVDLCSKSDVQFQCYHHHLVFMLEKVLSKIERNTFNFLKTFDQVNNYLTEKLSINIPTAIKTKKCQVEYSDIQDGSYFKSKISQTSELEDCLHDTFLFHS
ncbi:tRNA-dihydrouridine(20a/20b) synthase [NAD(P)+]-like isoform X2 [Halyomorpha halys]|uniref:tRNA-dihydrouridine(20a/20b) synthase [NAD(P)+]-like isoform X2 n=1 Tax=Halyomorpha halys TaxID=286706 RepID=UPI0034D36DA3